MTPYDVPELVCPAGSLPALKAAVDNGADCVYLGYRDATNARPFAGLNFDQSAIAQGIAYAHQRARKVLLALNTYPQAANVALWRGAVDRAAAGVKAIKIEGRQRSPAYVAQVTRVWREAIDACRDNLPRYSVKPAWMAALGKLSEGQQQTLGAYHRSWK